jgi:phosphopantetheinyl transferase (holo-ACP synthase)
VLARSQLGSWLAENGLALDVSISHSGDYASASVVVFSE